MDGGVRFKRLHNPVRVCADFAGDPIAGKPMDRTPINSQMHPVGG